MAIWGMSSFLRQISCHEQGGCNLLKGILPKMHLQFKFAAAKLCNTASAWHKHSYGWSDVMHTHSPDAVTEVCLFMPMSASEGALENPWIVKLSLWVNSMNNATPKRIYVCPMPTLSRKGFDYALHLQLHQKPHNVMHTTVILQVHM